MLVVDFLLQALYITSICSLISWFGSVVDFFSRHTWAENTLTYVFGVIIYQFKRLLDNIVLTFVLNINWVDFASSHFRKFCLSERMRICLFSLVLHLINEFVSHIRSIFCHWYMFFKGSMTSSERVESFVQGSFFSFQCRWKVFLVLLFSSSMCLCTRMNFHNILSVSTWTLITHWVGITGIHISTI
jgi:hypothetical protein